MSDETTRALEPDAIEAPDAAPERVPLELAVYEATPGGEIRTNIDAIVDRVRAMLADEGAWEIRSASEARDAKRARADVRKLRKRIDDERKRLKDLYEAPLREFEAQVRRATGPLDEMDRAYKAELDRWDAHVAAERMEALRAHYEEAAGELAELLDFDDLMARAAPRAKRGGGYEWVRPSFGEVRAMDELDRLLRRLASDWAALGDMEVADEAERDRLRAHWLRSLDLGLACSALVEDRRRERAIREQREADEAWRRSQMALTDADPEQPEPAPAPEPKPELELDPVPAPEPEPERRWRVVVDCELAATRGHMQEVGRALRALGLTGRITAIEEG